MWCETFDYNVPVIIDTIYHPAILQFSLSAVCDQRASVLAVLEALAV